jgi:hypothetical protein
MTRESVGRACAGDRRCSCAFGIWTDRARDFVSDVAALGAGFSTRMLQRNVPFGGHYTPQAGISSPLYEIGQGIGMMVASVHLADRASERLHGGSGVPRSEVSSGNRTVVQSGSRIRFWSFL